MARFVAVGQHAVGVIAIGQVATGVIAIGQIATGVIAIGQVTRGVVAIGMAAIGLVAIGMGTLGVCWSAGLVAVGARVRGLVRLPLVPTLREGSAGYSVGWAALGVVQLALLVAASVAFWHFAGVPVGDALFAPGGPHLAAALHAR